MMHIFFSTCEHLCNFTYDIQNKNSEQQNQKTKTKDFQIQSSDKTLGWEEILASIESLSSVTEKVLCTSYIAFKTIPPYPV